MAINHGNLSARLTPKKTLKGTVQTATIAYESDYERLTNKPSINNIEVIGDLSLDDLGIVNNVQPDWEQDDTEAEDYIKNKPEIPDAQIQSDWEQTDEEAKDYIKNKPKIPSAQVQSDWNEADNTKPGFIKNKPTIPPEQVNSDWNAVSGKAQILNKPTIPSVVANPGNTTENLTSIGIDGTNYAIQGGGGGGAVNDVKVNETSVVDSQGVANIDLTGYATTSDIPTDLANLQDDSTHRLVTDNEKTTWNNKSDFSGSFNDLTNQPTLGTASALDVASSGDASTSEVVKGNDTRLTDSRNAKDVYPWAKESTKPTYAYSEIQNTPTLGTASAKDYVNSVVDGSSDLVTSDAVHDYVDSAISGVYKPSGNKTCAELLPALLIASNLGNVYNMTDSGVTTSDFVEGAGKTIEVGDNVVIVDVGTQNNASYKFDLLSGMVDLSNYIQKSATSGLMKNDGSVDTNSYATTSQIPDITGKADKVTSAVDGNFAGLDSNGNLTDSGHKHSDYLTQHQDISGKADKVTSPTNGNIAGLNASGNLTDSGISGDMTTTSATGNPISIPNLKSAQIALNPVITYEPIQAGSGTPSPSNVRAISGYDKIEVLTGGHNIWDEVWEQGNIDPSTGQPTSSTLCIRSKNFIPIVPNTTYGGNQFKPNGIYEVFYYDINKNFISSYGGTQFDTYHTITTPTNAKYLKFRTTSAYGNTYNNDISINYPSTDTEYHAYHKTTDLSESLGQTVYGGTLDLRSGKLTNIPKIVDVVDLTWQRWGSGIFYTDINDKINASATVSGLICSSCFNYSGTFAGSLPEMSNGEMLECYTAGYEKRIFVRDIRYDDVATFKTALTGQKFVYKLATPFTIQLTPHEIALSSGYNYVSTNGTSISMAYHNGEVATHADVEQLAETVNELPYGLLKSKTFALTTNSNGRVTFGTISDMIPIKAYNNKGFYTEIRCANEDHNYYYGVSFYDSGSNVESGNQGIYTVYGLPIK